MDEPIRRNIQYPILEHGKVPPNVTELERAVLGACMLDPDCIQDVIDILTPESFYRIEHQKIFQAILELSTKDNPVDILTVSNFLKQDGSLEMVGGLYFVSQLTDNIASGANAEFHARIIQQKFIQREIIRISGESYSNAYEDGTDPIELLDGLTDQLSKIDSTISKETTQSNAQLVKQVIEDAERASQGGSIIGLPTGINKKDQLTGGHQGSSFIILAARPAMGKSALALQEAYHISVIQRIPCAFFSLEMPAKQLMLRMMSYHLGIPAWKIKTGQLDDSEWEIINKGVADIINSSLVIIDNLVSFQDINRRIKELFRKLGIKAAFIDYLQLMSNKQEKGNREQEISSISRGLKLTAKALDIPVIALAQLSRAVETRGGTKRPMLSDLRESGSLEQDADQVAFLYRPEYYGIETDEQYGDTHGLTEYILAKNRGGNTDTVPMKFNNETTSFSDWEEKTWSAPSSEGIPDTYRSPMPKSQEFGDIDSLTEDILGDDDVF